MKTTSTIRLNAELFLGILSIVLIPINKHLVVVVMSFWFLIALINFFINFSKQKQSFAFNKRQLCFFVFPIFYAIHLIGLIYTTNFDYAFFDLEIKLSMLLIPLTLWLRSDFYSDKQNHLIRALVYGSLISFVINIIHAVINYHIKPDIIYFFYGELSPIHPSYMSLYISLALISIIYLGVKTITFNAKRAQLMGIILFITLLIYLFLLSSKAGIITFILTILIFITAQYIHRIRAKYLITLVLVIIIVPIFLINSVPKVKYRFQGMITAVEHADEANIDSQESSMERVAIFITSSKLAYHKLPWGMGTGDTKDEIIENYKRLGSQTINERYLNAHNQYLQTTIALGIPGLIALLTIIAFGFKIAIKKKNILFLSFMILISINMFFESMLEQQAGVIFITLFFTLFCIWEKPKLNNQEKSVYGKW